MILGYTQKINGKPTYFVEKIHSAILQFIPTADFTTINLFKEYDIDALAECQPKLHTIREDKNDRWKLGTMIDFFINVRKKTCTDLLHEFL